jgi:hypothetical protein
MEMAELVREGVIKRQEALKRLAQTGASQTIEAVKAKLGLTTM